MHYKCGQGELEVRLNKLKTGRQVKDAVCRRCAFMDVSCHREHDASSVGNWSDEVVPNKLDEFAGLTESELNLWPNWIKRQVLDQPGSEKLMLVHCSSAPQSSETTSEALSESHVLRFLDGFQSRCQSQYSLVIMCSTCSECVRCCGQEEQPIQSSSLV
jgi:hypothetical protein